LQVDLIDYPHGAAVATALVNTAPQVQSGGEQLGDAAALARFLADHQVSPRNLADGELPTAEDLASVHALRDALRTLITAADPCELAERAGELAVSVGIGPVLAPNGEGQWQWRVRTRPEATLADELTLLTATAALSVLRTLGPDRFRGCASPACAGVFIDTSRGGRRRYCEPDTCGNRINVAAYRARRQAVDSAGRPSPQG